MEDVISVFNKLQDATSLVEDGLNILEVPQIVVVGSQSAGKSSVLESIVGCDFLPRGSGIVTRRPLILQLVNEPNGDPDGQQEGGTWAHFMHAPGKKFYDFGEVRSEIEAETERYLGPMENKTIGNKPINLRVHGPNLPNLTLVDLPGLTKVAVGNQPLDIELLIQNLVMQFISNPNSIVLAISPGNVDLANSDALKMARQVDPDGLRTIGVITKLDIMDKGTDASSVLRGDVYPLRLGYYGVVNRSQNDIQSDVKIDCALQKESSFFDSHPIYSKLPLQCGYKSLVSRLSEVLLKKMWEVIPRLVSSIKQKSFELENTIKPGETDLSSPGQARMVIIGFINDFVDSFFDVIDGKSVDLDVGRLVGGSRIIDVFSHSFASTLLSTDVQELTNEDIQVSICNSGGIQGSLYVPDSAFSVLVCRQIELLRLPSVTCLDDVYKILGEIVDGVSVDGMERFSSLVERAKEVSAYLLDTCYSETLIDIDNLISMEQRFLNLKHPDFTNPEKAFSQVADNGSNPNPIDGTKLPSTESGSSNSRAMPHDHVSGVDPVTVQHQKQSHESKRRFFGPFSKSLRKSMVVDFQVHQMRIMIQSYFDVVRTNFRDRIPKIITYRLVLSFRQSLRTELVNKLFADEHQELLIESSDYIEERKRKGQLLLLMRESLSILSRLDCSSAPSKAVPPKHPIKSK